MRFKSDLQPYFEFPLESNRKVVREYFAKYQAISQVLDDNPHILDLAHEDFMKLSERAEEAAENRDRPASYTSENILRALIVLCLEQEAYRKIMIRIDTNLCLKQFCRLGPRDVCDYTFLCRAFKVLSPETLKAMNEALATCAVNDELVDPSVVRTDTTVVETNIHYPTDASLLWDCARVLIRILREARELAPRRLKNRFHGKRLKRLYVSITRLSRSRAQGKKARKKQRRRKRDFAALIEGVERIADIAETFAAHAVKRDADTPLGAIGQTLEALLPDVRKVISQSVRAQLDGEKVPASERVFSIFESHTELIKRGKARKAVEFGHKVLLTEAEGSFITDYEVYAISPKSDRALAEEVIDRHEKLYGEPPDVVAADAGYSPDREKRKELEERVDVFAVPGSVADRTKEELIPWHRFRAGVEGTISTLKRAFGLLRCTYRGFNRFASNVGLGVLCHNLVVLARLRL